MTAALEEVAAIMRRAAVGFAFIGGHAVNAWLEPRFTADVDVVVEAPPEGLARLRSSLLSEGYRVAREHGAAQPSGPDFVRFISASGAVILEIQVAKTEFQRQVVARAASNAQGPPLATAEDLLVLKLIANRAKDQVDLRGLVERPGIDWVYVEQWAARWGVTEVLERLRERTHD